MINYRNFKKLLGETSLERKCRFLFGVALLLLLSGSFWLDAARTRQLVENQQVATARTLIPQLLWQRHYQRKLQQQFSKEERSTETGTAASVAVEEGHSAEETHASTDTGESESDAAVDPASVAVNEISDFEQKLGEASAAEADVDTNLILQWNLVLTTDEIPSDDQGFDAMEQFRSNAADDLFHFEKNEDGVRVLKYYQAIRASGLCLECHNGTSATDYRTLDIARDDSAATERTVPLTDEPRAKSDDREPGTYVAMASVTLSMANVEFQLGRNRAILLASAIITTFLAMLASYAIVRYIIVKPVLHLKDVSDEIALGNLNLRAEINTGDEFEELSHAFNRMLRHMTTVNDELRGLNDNLDAKVDQLAQANMELFNSNKLKDDFLATMSHELRTPLNSILGFSDILAGAANLNEKQQRYVTNIRTSGRNLMVQINDLLDLAKIESGQMKLQIGTVNAGDLIDVQVQQLMPLAEQKNIELKVTHPSPPLPDLKQDGGKMRQILTNLLSNAIKFTPEGGRVRVSSRLLDDDHFEICVEDTGIGIPLHEQESIFEKFRQGSTVPGQRDHMKREYGGTGLGLSIVRELSRLMGGDVHLESEYGKGSLFTLRLPIHSPPDGPEVRMSLESPTGKPPSRITSVDLLNQPLPASTADNGNAGSNRSGDS
ncbi:MAG: ATP-binding protein [Planctomycetaceae bacterium]